jgi:hypothetical protein
MGKKPDDKACLLYMNKKIFDVIDHFRKKSIDSRTSWIIKAILEKLRNLGYDTDKLFEEDNK